MKQLVFVHGGETFDTYKEYLDAMRTWDYIPPTEMGKRWKNSLPAELGPEWEVHAPAMPSKYNAKYLEWCIWFDKVVPYLTDGVIFVGHSLGGIFLAKYLEEGSVPMQIKATFLISAPHDPVDSEYSLADFTLPERLDRFAMQAGNIFLFHSEDDDVVPFEALSKYQAQLPDATVRTFTDRGHFLGSELPELIADIKALG